MKTEGHREYAECQYACKMPESLSEFERVLSAVKLDLS